MFRSGHGSKRVPDILYPLRAGLCSTPFKNNLVYQSISRLIRQPLSCRKLRARQIVPAGWVLWEIIGPKPQEGMVALRIKLPIVIPASHIASIQVLAASLPIQLSASEPGKSAENGPSAWICALTWETQRK